jgi:hypothetical protein
LVSESAEVPVPVLGEPQCERLLCKVRALRLLDQKLELSLDTSPELDCQVDRGKADKCNCEPAKNFKLRDPLGERHTRA